MSKNGALYLENEKREDQSRNQNLLPLFLTFEHYSRDLF